MVQAHPYRGSSTEKGPADMSLVHGIEVYNPHPLNNGIERFEDTLKLAVDNNLIKIAGSDFHINSQAGDAGMIVPDDIKDQFMLRDYLRKGRAVIFDRKGILYED